LDGARLWNASVASGIAEAAYAEPFDSVSVCFSKGLGAPVGSALAGSAEFIDRARRFRKQFGGGMRQVGILAAACIYALDNHLPRLAADHQLAQNLAEQLDNPLLAVNHPVETNIVIIDVDPGNSAEALLHFLSERNIKAVGFGPGRIRMVPNLGVTAADIATVVKALNAFTG